MTREKKSLDTSNLTFLVLQRSGKKCFYWLASMNVKKKLELKINLSVPLKIKNVPPKFLLRGQIVP